LFTHPTPPTLGNLGESGWVLEERLFGGLVDVTWLSAAAAWDFEKLERTTIRVGRMKLEDHNNGLLYILGMLLIHFLGC
jgi:hypothetical protein